MPWGCFSCSPGAEAVSGEPVAERRAGRNPAAAAEEWAERGPAGGGEETSGVHEPAQEIWPGPQPISETRSYIPPDVHHRAFISVSFFLKSHSLHLTLIRMTRTLIPVGRHWMIFSQMSRMSRALAVSTPVALLRLVNESNSNLDLPPSRELWYEVPLIYHDVQKW